MNHRACCCLAAVLLTAGLHSDAAGQVPNQPGQTPTPGPIPNQPPKKGQPGQQQPGTPQSGAPKAGAPGQAAQQPAERRPPALEYALALLATLLVLVIVCMPSRKG